MAANSIGLCVAGELDDHPTQTIHARVIDPEHGAQDHVEGDAPICGWMANGVSSGQLATARSLMSRMMSS